MKVVLCLLIISKKYCVPFVLLFLIACTDGAKQYDTTGAPDPSQKVKDLTVEMPQVAGRTDEPTSKLSDDELAHKNSLEPILYGIGAGGISFSTLLEDGLAKLNKPDVGPVLDSSGVLVTYHKSGLYLKWSPNAPRKLLLILILDGYLGSLTPGDDLPELRINSDLSNYITDGGEDLIKKLYRKLEGSKDPNYNCLETQKCSITPRPKDIILELPQMALLISKDRGALYRMLLVPNNSQGNLDNDFDIIHGRFNFEDKKIELGHKFIEANELIDAKTDTKVNTDYFVKNYSGIYSVISKSHYEEDYLEPDENEILKELGVYSGFTKRLKLNNQFVEVLRDKEEKVELKLTLDEGSEESPKELLNLKPDLNKKSLPEFMNSMTMLLMQELRNEFKFPLTFTRQSGLFKPVDDKSITNMVVGFDEKLNSGRVYVYEMSEGSGGINFVSSQILTDPFNKITIPASLKLQTTKVTEGGIRIFEGLGGIQIGQDVLLTEVDNLRNEATVHMAFNEEELITRSSFDMKAMIEVSSEVGKVKTQDVARVGVGDIGVTLQLLPLALNEDESISAKVLGVTSGNQLGGISGLCGLDALQIRVGEKDKEVHERIVKAVKTKKIKDKDFKCDYFIPSDSQSTGLVKEIYFVSDKVKLTFEDKELQVITAYAFEEEIQ